MRHLLSLSTLDQADFLHLIERGRALGAAPKIVSRPLAGRCIGVEFRKTSTRTRTSFAVAAVRLGAHPLIYGPADLQTNTGETIEDTVRVLGKYLDAHVIRTAADPVELERMARADCLPIVNAMSAAEHPSQALCDMSMILRRFPEPPAVRFLYCGEANNTATALMYAASRLKGFQADFRTPAAYGFAPDVLATAAQLSRRYGGRISASHQPPRRDNTGAIDVIYTTRWQTTGTSKPDPNWRADFLPFQLSESRVSELLADSPQPTFMHDLPAVRGEECDGAVLDGPFSIAFDQAEQKLLTAVAILEWCVGLQPN